uniref:Uncharacterized protein n=1 Tax=Oryza punctata TaxID=4537 RepID=A0A0E0L9I2_ORYPU
MELPEDNISNRLGASLLSLDLRRRAGEPSGAVRRRSSGGEPAKKICRLGSSAPCAISRLNRGGGEQSRGGDPAGEHPHICGGEPAKQAERRGSSGGEVESFALKKWGIL